MGTSTVISVDPKMMLIMSKKCEEKNISNKEC